MPQLNPGPWFVILLCSWLVFLIIIPPKVVAFLCPNDPTCNKLKAIPSFPWHWPWF
uniref:ATP synthase complex subunit 8 n=1 Tax=Platycephalus cultellatus TaxID=1811512 RepID=A0A8K2ASC0_9TELE|nr:ATP synthase F0 subunit 8 [Platycephalus cultellatus]UEX92609.1 ATP synthase F0 subunit 8 [Platycephalus cultellatus]UKB88257.1 ATP synthase F0 subunit 8 [Platycephalus cultellatus]WRI15791.1 ATP synthase F0 subunit 8 [Platycephalus cultellatus]